MEIRTLTLNQAVKRIREVGIKTSPQKLGNGIEQGVYRFGSVIRSDKGRRLFEIFESDLNKWLEEKAGKEV